MQKYVNFYVSLEDHSIIWGLGLERTLQAPPTPSSSAAQGPIRPGLERLQGWGTTAWSSCCSSLGSDGPAFWACPVPLDGILLFYCINCTTQLGVIRKPAEGTLDPTVCGIDKDVEEH